MTNLLTRFCDFYRELNSDSLNQLEQIYHRQVDFCDPVHCVHDLDQLRAYFESSLEEIIYCGFEIIEVIEHPQTAFVTWTMKLRHPRLNRGNLISLPGATHLRFNERIFYHHDYFDLGAMLYEQLPFLGRIILAIKRRLTGKSA